LEQLASAPEFDPHLRRDLMLNDFFAERNGAFVKFDGWDQSPEATLFNLCFNEYVTQYHRLVDLVKGESTWRSQLGHMFRTKADFDWFQNKLKSLRWINENNVWSEDHTKYILPLLAHLTEKGAFNTVDQSAIANAFVASYSSALSFESIRRFDKVKESAAKSFVQAEFPYPFPSIPS
jgi:hypothetical protein